jgi:enoyl-[acyl-carrier protein] reductase II
VPLILFQTSTERMVEMDHAGSSRDEIGEVMGGLRDLRIGMLEGNTDEGYISLGTGIGSINDIVSVERVVNQLAIL